LLLNVLKPIDQVLIALQFYVSGGLLQVVGDTSVVHFSPPFHWQSIADAFLETITVLTHGKITLRDTNCRLASRCEIKCKPHRGGFTEENKLFLCFETN